MTAEHIAIDLLDHDHGGMRYQHQVFRHAAHRAAGSAVALVPNFKGIADDTTELAREFLQAGRDVLVLDVFGAEGRPASFEQAVQRSEAIRSAPEQMTTQVRAAIAAYLQQRAFGMHDVALVGFCFGGAVALELARTGQEFRAVVALHSDLRSRFPEAGIQHRTRIFTAQGSADPLVPLSQIQAFQQEMARFDVEWQLLVLGGLYHAFTDPAANTPGVAQYDARGRDLSFRLARECIG